MTISPHDIQNKEFREAFRGYNEDDVDTFLDEVAEAYGRVFAENQRLRIQLASASQEAAQRGAVIPDATGAPPISAPAPATAVRAEERAEAREEMKRALVATQRAAEAALEEAKRRAGEIVARAEQRAKEIDEMTARRAKDVDSGAAGALTTIQARVEELRRQEIELRARLRRMLAEHVKMLQQLEGEAVAASASEPPPPAAAAAPASPAPPGKRAASRWDTPRVNAVSPDGPRPAGLGMRKAAAPASEQAAPRPMGLRPHGPAAVASEADTRAAVVARMTRDLGDAAAPPEQRTRAESGDAFWRR